MTTGLVYEEHTPVVNMVRMTIHYDCKKQKPRRQIKNIFADTRSRAPLSAVMAVAYALCDLLHLHICPRNRCCSHIREVFRSRAVCAAL